MIKPTRRVTTTRARRTRQLFGAVVCLALVAGACSRASHTQAATGASGGSTGAVRASATTTAAGVPAPTTTAGPGPGDFGTLKALCGPGTASGATARGVTDTEIHLGTMADPTNVVLPGIGQESFDIGNAFVKWCNAAGGINGRKLTLTTRDAKLFEVGARMIEACQSDFMLVGNANPLDEAGVEPRLKCDLAHIPAYATSAKAAESAQQVVVDSSIHQVAVGNWRALNAVYPQAFKAMSLITVNGGGLDSFAMRQRDAMQSLGYAVVDFQVAPITGVDNWRPYSQNAVGHNAQGVLTLSPDIDAFVRSMKDVGWTPALLPLGVQNYNAATIALAKEGVLPTTYVTTSFWPFEAADQNATMRQAIALIKTTGDKAPNFAHLQALSAWLLWATAAKECGSTLTGACVIDKAGAKKDWTAGGLRAPVDTHSGPGVLSNCFTMLKATATGFVLDPAVTKPNRDIFNCDPTNVVAAPKTYIEG